MDNQLPLILGGNQRDLARQKNLKKQAEQNKGKRNDNLTVEQRKQRCDYTTNPITHRIGIA